MECILTADTGTGDKNQSKVARAMVELIQQNKDISFIVIAGDNIYPSGCKSVSDEQFETKFRKPYKKVKLPFFLCLGNHDYGDLIVDYSDVQVEYTTSKYNKDNKWNMPSKWYSKSEGPCEIFFIDTNFDWLSKSDQKKQLAWAKKSINNSSKKWKILCGHHTWRSVGDHGNSEMEELESFMKIILKKGDIDLYICGHDHCKSLIEVGKDKVPTLVIGTGAGTEDAFHLENMKRGNASLKFYSPNLGLCHMKCDDNTLTLICYNELLKEEYEHVVKK